MSSGSRDRLESESEGEIIVVSGLPRSGTSMAMAMLAAGGLQCLDDGARSADEHNPNGYFEDERVKTLESDNDAGWIREARGKVVKVVSPLLKNLPRDESYKILFMLRDLDEVLASQQKMMVRRGEVHGISDDRMKELYQNHLAQVDSTMKRRDELRTKYVEFKKVIEGPRELAVGIRDFLQRDLDVEAMVAAVDAKLYRNRSV